MILEEVIAAEETWRIYSLRHNIRDIFADHGRLEKADIGYYWYPGEEISEEERIEYLRRKDEFIMWFLHFCIDDWDEFQRCGDASNYVPCDLVGRQCSMACEYFGGKCLREREKLKCPILDLRDGEQVLFPNIEI